MKRFSALVIFAFVFFSSYSVRAQEWGSAVNFMKERERSITTLPKDNLRIENPLLKLKEAEIKAQLSTPEEKKAAFRQSLTIDGQQIFDILMKDGNGIEDWQKHIFLNYLRNTKIPETEKMALAESIVEALAFTDGGKEILENAITYLTSDTYYKYTVTESTHVLSGTFEFIDALPDLIKYGEDRRPKITKAQINYNKIAADGYNNNIFFKPNKTLIASTLIKAYGDNFYPQYSTPDFLLEVSRKNTHRVVKAHALMALSKAHFADWRKEQKAEIEAKLVALYFATDDLADEIPFGSVDYMEFNNEFARAFARLNGGENLAEQGHFLADGSVIKTHKINIPEDVTLAEAILRGVISDDNPVRTYMNIFLLAQGAQGARSLLGYFKNVKTLPSAAPGVTKNLAVNTFKGSGGTGEFYKSVVNTNTQTFARQAAAQPQLNMPAASAQANRFVSMGGNNGAGNVVKLNPYGNNAFNGNAALKLNTDLQPAAQMRVIVSSSKAAPAAAQTLSASGRPVVPGALLSAAVVSNGNGVSAPAVVTPADKKPAYVGVPLKEKTQEEIDAERARQMELDLDSDLSISKPTLFEIFNLKVSMNLRNRLLSKWTRSPSNGKFAYYYNNGSSFSESYPATVTAPDYTETPTVTEEEVKKGFKWALPIGHTTKKIAAKAITSISGVSEREALEFLYRFGALPARHSPTEVASAGYTISSFEEYGIKKDKKEYEDRYAYPFEKNKKYLYRGMAMNTTGIEKLFKEGLKVADSGANSATNGNMSADGYLFGNQYNAIFFSPNPVYGASYGIVRRTSEKPIPVVVHIRNENTMRRSLMIVSETEVFHDIAPEKISRVSALIEVDGVPTWGQVQYNGGNFTFKPYVTK
ncbi:hypothetical protein Dip510_001502 [Elusimicrobium posterum]|uniref:hypothetical protein n=1 Tax=Elusimicrobium posterum TaxID=3116653 RepID=UPI003C7935AF